MFVVLCGAGLGFAELTQHCITDSAITADVQAAAEAMDRKPSYVRDHLYMIQDDKYALESGAQERGMDTEAYSLYLDQAMLRDSYKAAAKELTKERKDFYKDADDEDIDDDFIEITREELEADPALMLDSSDALKAGAAPLGMTVTDYKARIQRIVNGEDTAAPAAGEADGAGEAEGEDAYGGYDPVSYTHLVRPLLAGCKTLDALSDYEFYRTGCVERPVVASDHLEPFLAHGVKGLWTYYCIVQNREVANRFIAMPSARSRILGVQLYLYDIEGFLQWGYNFYNTQHSTALVDPYSCTDGGDAFPAGDPYLVYPGRDGMPEESIRLMTTCEALFDLRALRLLEALRGRAFVDALLHEGLAYRITFTQYPRGEAWLLDMRRRVNGCLLYTSRCV